MRVATWNIGGGFIESNQKHEYDIEDINYFIQELKSINPDIACFQEIHVSEKNDQPKIIADSLGFQYITTHSIAGSHLKDNDKLSISIISRFPVISSKFNLLPNPNLQFEWRGKTAFSHDKGFMEAVLDFKGTNIRVLSGHMVPFRKFGKNFLDGEFKEIRNQIEIIILHEKMPKIICADMNFNDEIEKLIPNVFENDFKFVLKNNPTTPKGRTYDKIIVSKEWESSNSDIINGKADHFLCFADIELKDK
ncbi:MAG: endonuclease/exonuclease/phosphatase family protein [Patescibacteria group bacterium]|jgi:endonuclease/exonuclease/phosphatase family metal-dependent hydrolase